MLLAAVLVVLSGLADSLDGAVAVMTGRSSRWGALLDSVVDRISDGLYLLAFWLVGAPVWLCVAAGCAVFLLEYARARAGAVGLEDVGVITVGERPTRIIGTAMFLLGAGWYASAAAEWATAGAGFTGAVATVAVVQLLVVVRRRLH